MFMPININMEDKIFLVIGGGNVALRRVKTLLDYEADIMLVAPEINEGLQKLQNEFKWIKSNYLNSFLKESHYVIAATDDENINASIKMDCSERFIPCLNVSNGKASDFHMPAIIQKGLIQISISTQGMSPGVSKVLKSDLDQLLNEEWMEKTSHIVAIRKMIKKHMTSNEKREEILVELATLSLLELKQRRQQYENQNWI